MIGLAAATAAVLGCEPVALKGGPSDGAERRGDRWPFAPASMRISPFTAIRASAGVEGAELDLKVELLDQVGDSTKGLGEFRFELYQAGAEERIGHRSPLYAWRASIGTVARNQTHYNSTLRTYDFRLAMSALPEADAALRVIASYTPRRGDRITAEAVIEQE